MVWDHDPISAMVAPAWLVVSSTGKGKYRMLSSWQYQRTSFKKGITSYLFTVLYSELRVSGLKVVFMGPIGLYSHLFSMIFNTGSLLIKYTKVDSHISFNSIRIYYCFDVTDVLDDPFDRLAGALSGQRRLARRYSGATQAWPTRSCTRMRIDGLGCSSAPMRAVKLADGGARMADSFQLNSRAHWARSWVRESSLAKGTSPLRCSMAYSTMPEAQMST